MEWTEHFDLLIASQPKNAPSEKVVLHSEADSKPAQPHSREESVAEEEFLWGITHVRVFEQAGLDEPSEDRR